MSSDNGYRYDTTVVVAIATFVTRLEVVALDCAKTEPATTKVATTQRPSIYVLPFANISGDPEQEYFSDGISEDIITDLTKISALHVVSRNTAFTF